MENLQYSTKDYELPSAPVVVVNKSDLQALYNLNKDKTKGNYTDASWNIFQTALSGANSILAKTSATQTEVDAAKSTLQSAISGLAENAPVVASKTELEGLYNLNKDKTKGNYTDASWNVFETALSNANSIIANTDATQAEVDAAKTNLQSAINGLVENTPVVASKTELEALYNLNKDKTKGNYTDASWNIFQTALSGANSILAKTGAIQAEVDAAKSTLQTAINGLAENAPVVASKTELEALYNLNKDKTKGNYTDASWNIFQTALSGANSILAKTGATQTEVDAAKSTLQTAVSGLAENAPVVASKTELEALYNLNKDKTKGNYTDASWNIFQTALSGANSILAKTGATQTEVDAAKSTLQTAVSGLAENAPVVASKTELEALYNLNKDKTKGNYTDASWNIFQTALSGANSILAKTGATQTEVDVAKSTLQTAVSGLAENAPVVASKTELQALYNLNKDKTKGNYTDASWNIFQTALSEQIQY